VQVRIIRSVHPNIDGIDTDTFKPGEVYELTALAANVLIAEGFAMPEMRRRSDRRQFAGSASPAPYVVHDRRTRRRRS
jgi:hypothetical protein